MFKFLGAIWANRSESKLGESKGIKWQRGQKS